MVTSRIEVGAPVYAVGEALSRLDKTGLITVIIVSVIAIVAFAWIFRETKKRD